ncbi:MAG: hypothetical protein IKX23_02085 [Treponema sp.]|nr:hypothetical protein [Treponema sp.]
MKISLKSWLIVLLQALCIVAMVLVAIVPFSCKITAEGVKLLVGDYNPPVLNSVLVVDDTTVEFVFSENVKVTGCVISVVDDYDLFSSMSSSKTKDLSEALSAASGKYGSIESEISSGESENIVRIKLKEKMVTGQKYEVYAGVKDNRGNSLSFVVPFIGYNARLPKIIFSEIQSASVSSQTKSEKENGFYRNEFVELVCLSDGNLSGLEIISANDGEKKRYVFPAVEVVKGEIIVVHLRNRGNGCVSEEGNDLSLAKNSYSSVGIRDLWSMCEETVLGNKTDVVILRNSADNKLLDAVMYRDASIDEWGTKFIDFAQLVYESGIYCSSEIDCASVTTGLTDTKTIYRKDASEIRRRALSGEDIEFPIVCDADDWIVGTESAGRL